MDHLSAWMRLGLENQQSRLCGEGAAAGPCLGFLLALLHGFGTVAEPLMQQGAAALPCPSHFQDHAGDFCT